MACQLAYKYPQAGHIAELGIFSSYARKLVTVISGGVFG